MTSAEAEVTQRPLAAWAPDPAAPATAAAPPAVVTAPAAPTDRPELLVAGAFAGGLATALILKRLAR